MEQMKMIKTLQQSQQEYKSPFCWYNIVADMLMKVIADEEKVQQRETTKSLSSDNIKRINNEKNYDQRNKSVEKPSHLTKKNNMNTIIKEKKIKYIPYSQFRPKENYLTDRKEDHTSLLKPTRDTEFETMEYPELVSKTSMDSKLNDISSLRKNYENYESPFLKCPLCGWEDIKYKEIEENSKKNYTSCSEYNKDIFGIYTNCAGCDKVTRDNLPYQSLNNTDLSIYYSKKNVNYSGDSEILPKLPKHTSNGNLITKSKSTSVESVKEKQNLKTYTNAEVQYSNDSRKSSKHDIETPMQINIPVITNKLQFDTIKASTHLKIILSDPNKSLKSKSLAIENAFQNMKFIQNEKLETSTKEIQVFPENIHQFKKNEIDTNTINYIDKEVQNTVSITDGIKKSVSLQTLNQIDQKENQTDKYKKNSTESKEVLVNIIDQISKGIQTTIFVSRGNLTCHISLQNMTETGTTMSIHQIRNIGCVTKESKQFKSNFVQCISKEKFPSLIQSKSCNSVTYIQNMDLKHCVKKKKSEDSCLINTCPQNILHLCKEDPSVMSLLQQLLQNILFIHEEKTQCGKLKKQIDFSDDHKYYPKENCLINPTKMVSAIKSHIMMLELKDIKELKESYQKLGTKSFSQGVQKKPSLKKIDTSICNNKLIMTEEIFMPIFRSTITKQDEKQKIMDKTLILDKKKKFLMTDKNVCTYLNCKDIGINGSFHRDIQIQSDSQLFKDSACLARDIRERVNVGVQKRDPILVRVIKCNENQAIIRSDKETLTMMTDMNYDKKYISKRIETCGRSTCIPSTICRKLSETNLKCALYKERANQVIDNYHKQHFKNNICDINCKNNVFYDWTNVTNNVVNSKIPMCVRSQKYMYARNK